MVRFNEDEVKDLNKEEARDYFKWVLNQIREEYRIISILEDKAEATLEILYDEYKVYAGSLRLK